MSLTKLTWAYLRRSYFRWALRDMAHGHNDYAEAMLGERYAQDVIDRLWGACASS